MILEYLEETSGKPLYHSDPMARAHHRSWIEMAPTHLNCIAGLYNATDQTGFADSAAGLRARFLQVEAELGAGPWFNGRDFSLVDAAFGPVFRYFDVF